MPGLPGRSALHLPFPFVHHLSSKGGLVRQGFHTFKGKHWLTGKAAAPTTSSSPGRYPQGLIVSKEESSLDSPH